MLILLRSGSFIVDLKQMIRYYRGVKNIVYITFQNVNFGLNTDKPSIYTENIFFIM